MKLLNDSIKQTFPKLYSQDGKGYDALVHVKFFNPCGAATWFMTEGEEQENGDWLFFGWATLNGVEGELGYTTLSQLESVRLPFGLTIERDIHFVANRHTLREAIQEMYPRMEVP